MKAIILTAITGLLLSACAAPVEKDTIQTSVETNEDVNSVQTAKAKENMADQNKFTEVTMWQKTPGTSVYNAAGEVVDNLRLFPSVTVFEVQDISGEDWARIDAAEDRWVILSDLVSEKPDGMLERPVDTNGLDRIDRDALKRAVETGVRPGDQE